jgi:tetratricopeptide (TPR) repeat protein
MSRAAEEVGALLALGRAEDAGRRAKELLATHPDDVWLHLNAAMAWSTTGEWDLANRSIDFGIGMLPDDAEVYRVASIVRERCGDNRGSFTLAQRAVELASVDVSMHLRMAFAGVARRNRAGMVAARRSAEAAIRLAPDHPESYNALGAVQMASNAFKKAAESFGIAVELEPESAIYHQNLAGALAKLGRRGEASQHLVAAGRADLGSTEPINRLRGLRKFGGLLATIVFFALVVVVLKSTETNGSASRVTTTVPGTVAQSASGAGSASGEKWPVDYVAMACFVFLVGFVIYSVRRWRLHPDAAAVLKQDAEFRHKRFGRRRRH